MSELRDGVREVRFRLSDEEYKKAQVIAILGDHRTINDLLRMVVADYLDKHSLGAAVTKVKAAK